MTVETQTTKVVAAGNDTATTFSFSPIVLTESGDLVVSLLSTLGVLTTLTETTDYTVSVSSYPGTGSISYPVSGSPLATGEKIIMKRVLTVEQTVDLNNQGGYFADTQEGALDRLTMVDLQQQETLDRVIRFNIADTLAPIDLPLAADRAGLALVFDSDGQVGVGGAISGATVSSAMIPVVEAASLALARTALGSTTVGDAVFVAASAAAARAALGLTIGTSGAAVPLLNAEATFSALLTAALGLTVTGAGVVVGAPSGGDKGVGTINVAGVTYKDGSVTTQIAQIVNTETGAYATGTTVMPLDDTIPQNTEGDQYMSLAITPKSATSTLIIDVVFNASPSTTIAHGVALFQDTTAGALAAVYELATSAGRCTVFRHKMTSGTTSATTFKVRAGPQSAGSVYFNGTGAARLLGGVMASSITITEILP